MTSDGGRRGNGAGRGGPARGYSWPPAGPGNLLAAKHHAYAAASRWEPEIQERVGEIVAVMPMCTEADLSAVRLLAVVEKRIDLAVAALDEVDERTPTHPLGAYVVDQADRLDRLRHDLRGWINTARRLCNDLGLTPTSRAKLGLNVVRAQVEAEAALAGLEAEGRRLRLAADGEGAE